jgi:hypothetical protein
MKRRAAVFTIVQNEPYFLPIWLRYYRRHFDNHDLYIIAHDDPLEYAARWLDRSGPAIVPVHRSESFDHAWLCRVVSDFQHFLLNSYECVLFTEIDEIVAHPPAGLAKYIERFAASNQPVARCVGYEILQMSDEQPLKHELAVLAQRRACFQSPLYDKPLLARVPLRWQLGFHQTELPDQQLLPDPVLPLLHLHRVDFERCLARTRAAAARKWSRADVDTGAGRQNRITDENELRRWFYEDDGDGRPIRIQPIPADFRGIEI